MTAESLQLTLRFVSVADPVAGQLLLDGKSPRPFTGWLQLISALQEAIEAWPGGREPLGHIGQASNREIE